MQRGYVLYSSTMEQKGIIFGTKITYFARLILKEVKFIMRKKALS